MERLPGSLPIGGRFAADEGLLPPLEPDDPHAPSNTAPPSPAAPMRNDLRSIEATISPYLSSAGWTTLPIICPRVQSPTACGSHDKPAFSPGARRSPRRGCAAAAA